ncbi:hypothetical protein [Streptoalloteichus hindustanus]|uniref:Uncharacterized protein n=1 Tax=Streptoalloteichus hindustanus TaxID=2017 RepID=A0A1M5P1N0_STRHI|nr:hypothetical protein [Streptoalloteichus hindustanus]SHG95744.1 hypothetical protein SAMN05444320_11741 [Streptoalloteichus hindustanus]
MEYGIYPGSVAGDDRGGLATGPADDPSRILAALRALQGDGALLVRGYLAFTDPGRARTQTPHDLGQYAGEGRRLDVVAQYQSESGDVPGYLDFVRDLLRRLGPATATLQIAEEPNLTGNPTLDGHYPEVRRAVVEGVIAARAEADRLGLADLRVGFNTTPLFGPAATFLSELTALGGQPFLDALGYVGLDFFPDVFVPTPDPGAATAGLLAMHRDLMTSAGIPTSVPLHITENGWPTGPDRTPERQAEVLRDVLGAVVDGSAALNIGAYLHFSLRDANSSHEGLFHRFGLLHDDYSPKPAFAVYQRFLSSTAP